jgi:type IV secretory pathway VirB2 component (pilin)
VDLEGRAYARRLRNSLIGLVALIVAVVILVFFGIGYLFGRAFL